MVVSPFFFFFLITPNAQQQISGAGQLLSRDAINPSLGASLQPSGLQRPVTGATLPPPWRELR